MENLSLSTKKQSGFTLVELLVVVAIIAILAAVGIPAYNGYQVSSRAQAQESQFVAIHSHISAEAKRCSSVKSMQYYDGTGAGTFAASMTGVTLTGTAPNQTAAVNCKTNFSGEVARNHFNDPLVDMNDVYQDGAAVTGQSAGTAAAVQATLGTFEIGSVASTTIANGIDISITACLDARGDLDGTCDAAEQVTRIVTIE